MEGEKMDKKKINTIVGSIGAFIGIFVFIAYIPQIIANIQGVKAQPWQPLFASFSCLIWVVYGWTKEPQKDYILIIPNTAGVILGFLTFITAF
jgi:membrane protein